MTTSILVAGAGARKISRDELHDIPTPEATATHQPLAHAEVIEALVETLSFRQLKVVRDEYAVSTDGMKMFGILDLDGEGGSSVGGELSNRSLRFAIGVRNSNDKSMRLAMTAGYRVFVCSNMAFKGDFLPVFRKHTKHLELRDCLSVGVDKIQRSFEPMRTQIESWHQTGLSNTEAKEIIYDAFMDKSLGVPKAIMPSVHQFYFRPMCMEFRARSLWSLSNAFTSAFKELSPIRQFQATAKLGGFLESYTERLQTPQLKPLQAASLPVAGEPEISEFDEPFDEPDELDMEWYRRTQQAAM